MKNEDKNNKQSSNKDFIKAISTFSHIGISMASCVIIGVFIGRFLDRIFGTSPWLLLIFSLFGAFAAIKSLFDMSKK